MLPGVVRLMCVSCLPTALERCAPTALGTRILGGACWPTALECYSHCAWPSIPRDMLSDGYAVVHWLCLLHCIAGSSGHGVFELPLHLDRTVDLVHWLCLTHYIACCDDIGPWLSVLATLVVGVVRISLS